MLYWFLLIEFLFLENNNITWFHTKLTTILKSSNLYLLCLLFNSYISIVTVSIYFLLCLIKQIDTVTIGIIIKYGGINN